jgi:cytosine/adenosine deaminase-related metal-dependent hydrolase
MAGYVVGGQILCGSDFEAITGYVHVEAGRIVEIEQRSTVVASECRASGIVMPALINAHAHLGDSIIKDVPFSDLDSLVKPPHGVKHRVLRETPVQALIYAMQKSLQDALLTGTSLLADFREGGLSGINALTAATRTVKKVRVLILGRPSYERDYIEEDEIDTILDAAYGLGISGTRDFSTSRIETLINRARMRRKFVAIHAGEKDGLDIDSAIGYNPDCLVHMTYASKRQIECGIPIVVCPRSNLVTRVGSPFLHPPISKMLEATIVGLGTDNAMLNSLNMFAEMEFASKAFVHDDLQVLRMATINNAKILKVDGKLGSIEPGKQADLLVLNNKSNNLFGTQNVVSSVVRRARPDDILLLTQGG